MPTADGISAKSKDLPLLLVNRDTLKKWRGEIKADTYALLQKYVAFHQKVVGVKPEESELVDRALVAAFKQDAAFQRYLNSGGKTAVGVEQNGGEKGGGSEVVS